MAHCGERWSGSGRTGMPEASKSRIGIVAALEREVRPLIKNWRVSNREHEGRQFRVFETDDSVLVCGGIGVNAARRAAEALIVLYRPWIIYSTGFAGALNPEMRVGDVFCPNRVVNASDGSSIVLKEGKGVLVSFGSVANAEQKRKLRESFGGDAVDMEAAAVLRATEVHGISFGAVKAISDGSAFDLPPTERFVDAEGKFSESRFALFTAMRPWTWPQVLRLARNSQRASRALCAHLEGFLIRGKAGSSKAAFPQ